MKDLCTAIDARFTAASLSSTITGGLHFINAPPGTSMPYAVYTVIASPSTAAYGSGSTFTEPLIQFTVRGVGASAVLILCESLRDAYKHQSLSLSSGQHMNVFSMHDPIPEPTDPEQDEQSRDSYGWIWSAQFAST